MIAVQDGLVKQWRITPEIAAQAWPMRRANQ
jgi:hypothetical protein